MAERERELVNEIVGAEPYAYYPLGEHIVAAPGVCSGRPTFKYTRIEVAGTLDRRGAGATDEENDRVDLGWQRGEFRCGSGQY